jgi:hypothetical protein
VKLKVAQTLKDREIAHHADGELLVTSRHNRVYIQQAGSEQTLRLPTAGWERVAGVSRIVRRGRRLDKCNVVPVGPSGEQFVIMRQGTVYHYELDTDELHETLELSNCRNVLHQSIEVIDDSFVVFGEYGSNSERKSVPVYLSRDAGRSWHVAYEFEPGAIRHVHGCYWDSYAERIWMLTGDYEGECYFVSADPDFDELNWHGDGSQLWRACNVFFEQDALYWLMDSHLQTSYVVRYDRASGNVERLRPLPGPVWYIKRLSDGWYLAATACEEGDGVKDEFAHVFASRDGENWEEIGRFRHDGWPKGYFKFGVIGFADGEQSSDEFYLFGEALEGIEGSVAKCRLVD